MSATLAVSVRNISCTISNSSWPRPYPSVPKCASGFAPTTYRAFSFEAFEKLWGCGAIPTKPGLTTPQMVTAAQAGKLKALDVVGANALAYFGPRGCRRGE